MPAGPMPPDSPVSGPLPAQRRRAAYRAGFTLLELAIVLTIVAVMMGGGLSLYAERLMAERVRETNTRLERVESALKLYVQTFGTLPCPMVVSVGVEQNASSSPALPTGVNPYGRQTCDASKHDANLVVAIAGNRTDGTSRFMIVGGVPTRTLGISDSMALDGWNNRIMYAVDNEYSYSSATPLVTSTAQFGPKNGGITIMGYNDADEKTNCGGDCPGQAGGLYALFSYGPNGWGAFRAKSLQSSPSRATVAGVGSITGTTKELANAHIVSDVATPFTVSFRDTTPKQSDSATTYFDDMVRWKTRIQF